MRDTDIYADAYRAPDSPPTTAADTGSKHATPGVDPAETTLRNRGDTA